MITSFQDYITIAMLDRPPLNTLALETYRELQETFAKRSSHRCRIYRTARKEFGETYRLVSKEQGKMRTEDSQ